MSTSVEKLFCAMAATVEYHEKPTGTQSDLVKTSLGNMNPVLLHVLVYLTLEYATFDSLKPEAKMEPLQKFVSCIEENWICCTVWPLKCWSLFMQSIRTNNDIGGWHHSLNRRAAG